MRDYNRAWQREWNAGSGWRFPILGHILYPSRYARGPREPTAWFCGICLREYPPPCWWRAWDPGWAARHACLAALHRLEVSGDMAPHDDWSASSSDILADLRCGLEYVRNAGGER